MPFLCGALWRAQGQPSVYGKDRAWKTFLSNCIAKELLDQSYSVVYLPAVEMSEIFSKERFDYDSTEEDRDRSRYLLDCDLLIIDDLGTELVNTFTTSQLFYCINERLNRRKGTIISPIFRSMRCAMSSESQVIEDCEPVHGDPSLWGGYTNQKKAHAGQKTVGVVGARIS